MTFYLQSVPILIQPNLMTQLVCKARASQSHHILPGSTTLVQQLFPVSTTLLQQLHLACITLLQQIHPSSTTLLQQLLPISTALLQAVTRENTSHGSDQSERHKVKPEKFDGSTDWADHLRHFEMVAGWNGCIKEPRRESCKAHGQTVLVIC